jgi:PAS domain S-box-containing protein
LVVALAVGTAALGALSLWEVLLGSGGGVESWLFQQGPGVTDPTHPGRISPAAAFCALLVATGLGLASGRTATGVRLSFVSALSVALIIFAGLAFAGHVILGAFNVLLWNYTGLSLHTSAGFLTLGFALLVWVNQAQSLFWRLDVRTTAGFVVGVVALLGAAAGNYIFTSHLGQDAEAVSHSQEVLKEIEQVISSQHQLTTTLDRYLITHDEATLASREAIRAAILEDAQSIRRLTRENAQQQDRIQEVMRLTDRRLALADQIISRTRQQLASDRGRHAAPAATSVEESPLGTEYPNIEAAIEALLGQMERQETALLEQRQTISDASSKRAFSLMPLTTYLSATVLLLGMFLLNLRTETERRAEEARNELEGYFRAIFDASPDAIVVADADRTIVMANPAAERQFGYPAGALNGLPIQAISGAEAAQVADPERELRLGPRESLSAAPVREVVAVRKDGSTFPAELARSVLSTPRGTFVVGIGRDISERKVIDEARARMVAIVESSDDAIIGKDLNGIVSSWNRGAEKIFGYSAVEMIGQSILQVVPRERYDEEADILARIRCGESIEHAETTRVTKDGRLIDVSIRVSPIHDAAGNVIGASKIARDITTSKHLEQQLRQSQKMEAVGQLTGGVAHDFNNLLGVILGNLDLMERGVAGNDALTKRLQNAQRAAIRGADLTRRMLAFSSRQPLMAVPTSVAESAGNMIEMAKRALGPEIEIHANLDPSLPLVLVDPSGLENALLNLAVNARDAMPDGGSILISARIRDVVVSDRPEASDELRAGRYVTLEVSDTGHGMSRETLQRAFEPFFTTKARGKGTGLGLAMVYGFAKQSGGTARVYSEVGHGTTVTLYLPLAQSPSGKAHVAATPKLSHGKGQVVLVVDDEADLLEVAVAYLEEMGYRALHASDGVRALEVLALEPDVDLLVTDVIMPGGMNGVELARKVRQLRPGMRVVYSSGFPSDALSQKNGTRVDGPLIYKPYQRGDFAAVVQRAMASQDEPFVQSALVQTNAAG